MKRTITALLTIFLCAALSCTALAARISSSPLAGVDPYSAAGRAKPKMMDLCALQCNAEGIFDPNAPISAADYVIMLAKLRGLKPLHGGGISETAGYMQAALDAGWYNWDEIPPDRPERYKDPIERQIAANILIRAFFGSVQYDWSVHSLISDFSVVSGRYYLGVLGGLSLGLFDQQPGTPFFPARPLTREDACRWAFNAAEKYEETHSAPAASPASPAATSWPSPPEVNTTETGASKNGWLTVRGTQLCNEVGEPIVLHGMSSMGIQWYPQYTNRQCLENTAAAGAGVFRIAMYTEEGGYLSDKPKFRALVEQVVENAVALDMYVIIDWHNLSDGNPMQHIDDAREFFQEMSEKYADTPNVIYEICNEPNGGISWARDVKPYAEDIVSVIRQNSARSIILIGSPTWSQDVDIAAADPVPGTNLMYTLHFYAGTHGQGLRDKALRAIELGAPLFASEWGTSDASGSGGVFLKSSDEWVAFLNEHAISWCNWSLCDKNETSAALCPGAPNDVPWTDSDLTESGRYVFARFGTGLRPTPSENPGPLPDASHSRIVPVTSSEVAAEFAKQYPHCTVQVSSRDHILAENDIVSTGCTVLAKQLSSNEVVAHSDIVVYGDVLGTGDITLSQLVRMSQAATGVRPLSGLYLLAADMDNAPGVGLTDLVLEANLLLHGGTLRFKLIPVHTSGNLPRGSCLCLRNSENGVSMRFL